MSVRLFLRTAILLLAVAAAEAAPRVKFDYGFIERELEKPGPNRVHFAQVADTPIVYRAWCVWNMKHSAAAVAQTALDFERYEKTFRYVHACDRIVEPRRRLCPLGTWYVEGRASVARVWAIGNIDTLCWTDSAHLRFIAHQNEDRRLESAWGRNVRGWLNFRTHGVGLAAFVVAAGENSCRVGVVAQGWVRKPMPQWLVRLGTSLILPQLLQDLEREVDRRQKAALPRPAPWYDRWFKDPRQPVTPGSSEAEIRD